MKHLRTYAKAQQETASPERLMVLLFETALRHMRTGAAALDSKDFVTARTVLGKASDIVVELMSTFDARQAPALAEQLGDLYQFVSLRLTRALTTNDPVAAREAERVFAPVASAFSEAVAQLPSAAGGER